MDENYIVTKSNYFIMNSSYDLSMQEQKIILTLASMVQPTDEDFRPYKFKIIDFMKLLGISTKTKYTEIPKITKELMKKVFEINEGKKLIQTAWLSGAVYEKGTGCVELAFSPYLKPYMLQLKENFTRYKLGNILNMKSKYSPRVYEFLKCNEFKKQVTIELEDLKIVVGANEKAYKVYQNVKKKVILQAQKELSKLTDISFDFEEIKTGRKVTSLKFNIQTKSKLFKEPIPLSSIADEEVSATTTHMEEENSIKKVMSIMSDSKIEALEAKKIIDTANGDINIIKEKYDIVSQMKRVGSVVATMIDAIKKDYQAPKGNVTVAKGSFNDYEQRTYDFDELEKRLLGWDKDEVGEEFQQLSVRK
ncbi:replication initiation protein [Clostridium estertheticum]|uniref:replication initiation protein n=1 Tax=Clostridium estertheticum TaxID=238834 RepID=UPI001CF37F80|nr:replication initiation protein [Clostridium estertheticum]MCB2357118.1 replication initiation protein [Clostridium estertheticum]WAG44041.1 replication initiation protein [Clostridium estertheticum]